jgi:hypothetical protein
MEGHNDATQQPANGGAQQEAEALAERRRQANGQHDNQRSSGGRRCGCDKTQSCRLRCGGSQACEMGEGGRPEMLRESNGQHYNQPIERGGGDGRRWTLNGRRWTAYIIRDLCRHCYYDSHRRHRRNRTEQYRKFGTLKHYYLDKFNQTGVFICHKRGMQNSVAIDDRIEGSLPNNRPLLPTTVSVIIPRLF